MANPFNFTALGFIEGLPKVIIILFTRCLLIYKQHQNASSINQVDLCHNKDKFPKTLDIRAEQILLQGMVIKENNIQMTFFVHMLGLPLAPAWQLAPLCNH